MNVFDLAKAIENAVDGATIEIPAGEYRPGARLTVDGEGLAIVGVRKGGDATGRLPRASDSDDMMGCHNLAVLLATGRGIEPNDARAGELFRKACHRGLNEACRYVED